MKPKFGKRKPTKYEKKFLVVDTYHYRGYDIDVFDDDCGQAFYFYFNNKSYNCGAFNLDYKHEIESVVDYYLDSICTLKNYGLKYTGGYLRFSNHEHTKYQLLYRLNVVYEKDYKQQSKSKLISEACEALDKYLVENK